MTIASDDDHRRPPPHLPPTDRELLEDLVANTTIEVALLTKINETLTAIFTLLSTQNQTTATRAVLTVRGGHNMALTVDTTTGNAVLGFEDDHNDVTGPPAGDGSGLVVTFTSDNPAVATVGSAVAGVDAEGNGNFSAPISPLTMGEFNLSAEVANVSGAPLVDADGVTPFIQPTAVAVPVSAGQAIAGTLAVTE